jgi:flagellar hook-associated protein 3 FlgL
MALGIAQRVTQRNLNDQVSRNLQRNVTALGKLQNQLSSGKQISRPSDSPTGTVSALALRAEIRRAEQLRRNADDGLGWLGTADTTLTQALDSIRRVRDLALQGANGASSTTDRQALAAEAAQLRDGLLQLANASYLGQPIFGGTASVTEPFDPAGAYLGNTGAIERTIGPNASVQVNLAGSAVFGAGPTGLFATLDAIVTDLTTNPTALTDPSTTNDVRRLDNATLLVQNSLSVVGARYNQLEAMAQKADDTKLNAASRLAEVEDIDLPFTVMELQLQEVAYQASLGAAARVLQPSLVDFLR